MPAALLLRVLNVVGLAVAAFPSSQVRTELRDGAVARVAVHALRLTPECVDSQHIREEKS